MTKTHPELIAACFTISGDVYPFGSNEIRPFREMFGIPDDAEAYTAMAIGYRDSSNEGDTGLRERERKTRQRLPQREFVFSNRFGDSADF